jgi:hypothetical protein
MKLTPQQLRALPRDEKRGHDVEFGLILSGWNDPVLRRRQWPNGSWSATWYHSYHPDIWSPLGRSGSGRIDHGGRTILRRGGSLWSVQNCDVIKHDGQIYSRNEWRKYLEMKAAKQNGKNH